MGGGSGSRSDIESIEQYNTVLRELQDGTNTADAVYRVADLIEYALANDPSLLADAGSTPLLDVVYGNSEWFEGQGYDLAVSLIISAQHSYEKDYAPEFQEFLTAWRDNNLTEEQAASFIYNTFKNRDPEYWATSLGVFLETLPEGFDKQAMVDQVLAYGDADEDFDYTEAKSDLLSPYDLLDSLAQGGGPLEGVNVSSEQAEAVVEARETQENTQQRTQGENAELPQAYLDVVNALERHFQETGEGENKYTRQEKRLIERYRTGENLSAEELAYLEQWGVDYLYQGNIKSIQSVYSGGTAVSLVNRYKETGEAPANALTNDINGFISAINQVAPTNIQPHLISINGDSDLFSKDANIAALENRDLREALDEKGNRIEENHFSNLDRERKRGYLNSHIETLATEFSLEDFGGDAVVASRFIADLTLSLNSYKNASKYPGSWDRLRDMAAKIGDDNYAEIVSRLIDFTEGSGDDDAGDIAESVNRLLFDADGSFSDQDIAFIASIRAGVPEEYKGVFNEVLSAVYETPEQAAETQARIDEEERKQADRAATAVSTGTEGLAATIASNYTTASMAATQQNPLMALLGPLMAFGGEGGNMMTMAMTMVFSFMGIQMPNAEDQQLAQLEAYNFMNSKNMELTGLEVLSRSEIVSMLKDPKYTNEDGSPNIELANKDILVKFFDKNPELVQYIEDNGLTVTNLSELRDAIKGYSGGIEVGYNGLGQTNEPALDDGNLMIAENPNVQSARIVAKIYDQDGNTVSSVPSGENGRFDVSDLVKAVYYVNNSDSLDDPNKSIFAKNVFDAFGVNPADIGDGEGLIEFMVNGERYSINESEVMSYADWQAIDASRDLIEGFVDSKKKIAIQHVLLSTIEAGDGYQYSVTDVARTWVETAGFTVDKVTYDENGKPTEIVLKVGDGASATSYTITQDEIKRLTPDVYGEAMEISAPKPNMDERRYQQSQQQLSQ